MTIHSVTSVGPPMSDDALRTAIEVANIPTLLLVLTQLTGNPKWLADPFTPTRGRGLSDNDTAGLSPELQNEVRASAVDAIGRWFQDGELAIPDVSEELAVRMLGHSMGETVPAEYGPLLHNELDPSKTDPRRLGGVFDSEASNYSAVVIGAGPSGIAAALALHNAGLAVTVIEQHDRPGGVWTENSYPNVGVDTPSHLYSFLWARHDWSRFFASGTEVQRYFEGIAKDFDILDLIRFDTAVLRSAWDANANTWTTTTTAPDGTIDTIDSTFVVSAVGAFNPPKFPDIEGLDTFEGRVFHTAEWPKDVDLRGKRVAIVGNGATSMQIVPAIVDQVDTLTVFQRQPQWIAPFEKCRQPVPEALRDLLRTVPLYDLWYRTRLSWMYMDRMYDALRRDPNWDHPDRAVNKTNDRHRQFFTDYLRSELEGRDDLVEALTPSYPPFGKRILLDNGWFKALRHDNTTLVSNGIARVDEHSIETRDGRRFEVDVFILATGFHADRFLDNFEVIGRSGVPLIEQWEGDNARAYLGTVVPDFPNFFCLYGPNAAIGHGGSLLTIAQYQLDYTVDLIRQVIDSGAEAFELKREVNDNYNDTVDEMHENLVWSHPGMSTYYRNSRGRVVVVNPWRVLDYYTMTRHADLDEYEIAGTKKVGTGPR